MQEPTQTDKVDRRVIYPIDRTHDAAGEQLNSCAGPALNVCNEIRRMKRVALQKIPEPSDRSRAVAAPSDQEQMLGRLGLYECR